MAPIGIFDSGIGGLSVAGAVAGLLPEEHFVYVADSAYAPYGPRSAEEILLRSRKITAYLLGAGAKMIVIACNTATSVAIDALRAEYPEVPFVGMEPAVKPAAGAGRVGVMATAATLKSERYLSLRDKYLGGEDVLENACVGLVPLIEASVETAPRLRGKLNDILQPMLAAEMDTLVLGCTHYPMVKDEISAICGPAVSIIDPSPAAARQVERLLRQRGLAVPPAETAPGTRVSAPKTKTTAGEAKKAARSRPRYDFFATGGSAALQRALWKAEVLNRNRKLVVPRLEL